MPHGIFKYFLMIFTFHYTISYEMILVSSYYPITHCSLNDPYDQNLFKGIEVDLIKDAMSIMNKTYEVDYIFKCVNWDDLFNILSTYNRSVIGAVAGITITAGRMNQGYIFSQPTFSTGMSIMYVNHLKDYFFVRGFESIGIIITLMIIPFIIGFFIYTFEGCSLSYRHYAYHALIGYFKMVLFDRYNLSTKVLMHVYFFIIVIIINEYTSVMTILFNNDKSYGGLYQPQDIQGKVINVWYLYAEYILAYNGYPISDNLPDLTTDELIDHYKNVEFLGTDGFIIDYMAMVECNYYVALQNIIEYEFGMMMNENQNRSFVQNLNEAIVLAYENISQKQRWANFFKNEGEQDICENKPVLTTDSMSISDFAPFWIFYAIGFGIGLGWEFFLVFLQWYKRRLDHIYIDSFRNENDEKVTMRIRNFCAFYLAASMKHLEHYKKYLLEEIIYDIYRLYDKANQFRNRIQYGGFSQAVEYCLLPDLELNRRKSSYSGQNLLKQSSNEKNGHNRSRSSFMARGQYFGKVKKFYDDTKFVQTPKRTLKTLKSRLPTILDDGTVAVNNQVVDLKKNCTLKTGDKYQLKSKSGAKKNPNDDFANDFKIDSSIRVMILRYIERRELADRKLKSKVADLVQEMKQEAKLRYKKYKMKKRRKQYKIKRKISKTTSGLNSIET